MFINITTSETGDNKGSSGALVNYLEKENQMQIEKGKGLEQENWFNGTGNEIRRQEVRMKIDSNIAKLGRSDSKFFLINISPSQKELAHLYEVYGKNGTKEKLKEFAIKVMDEYAKNFKRPGINSHKDLLWYGKHENYRYYKHTDKEVKDGRRKTGERKDGRQDHIQIIVSRKDITNRIKLSPQNTSKGKNKEHSAKLGEFNRTAFKQSGEKLFDTVFDFNRGLKETIDYANIMKNGTSEQKMQMQILDDIQNEQPKSAQIAKELSKSISEGLFENIGEMITSTGKVGSDFLSILMEPVYV
ncbi:MAG: molybdopterin-guanine dinucleotide biosynthesis protein MobB, partial [Chryseobacterium sp.]